jgi:hypothetical protein
MVASMFALSNWGEVADIFVHKIWEFFTGAMIGITLGFLMAGRGSVW